MKFKCKSLIENAVREGVYIGLAKVYPANNILTIETTDIIDNVTEAIMNRLNEIIDFEQADSAPSLYETIC